MKRAKEFPLFFWQWLLIVIMFFSFLSEGKCFDENSFIQKDLLAKSVEELPGFDRLFYFTRWPDIKKILPVKEILNAQYSCETLINEVMKPGVLRGDWKEKFLCVKNWIPQQVFGKSLDAYLYRQPFKNGTLHICDTRPILLISFLAGEGQEIPLSRKDFAKDTLSILFQFEFPREFEWKTNAKTGWLQGAAYYNVRDWPPEVQERLASKIGVCSGLSSFALNCTVCDRLVIFEFQKDFVSGCNIDARYPLFQEAAAEPSAGATVLETLKGFTRPTIEDIPALMKLLAALPPGPSFQQIAADPYENESILKAKLDIVKILVGIIENIQSGGEHEINLIRQSLKVEDYMPNPDENPSRGCLRKLKRETAAVLERIGGEQAYHIHKEMVDQEKDLDIRTAMMKEIDKYRNLKDHIFVREAAERRLSIDSLGWQVGDTWVLRVFDAILTRPDTESTANESHRDVCFMVVGRKDIFEKSCYEIEVSDPNSEKGSTKLYKLYFRTDTGNLVRIVAIGDKLEPDRHEVVYDFPLDPNGPVMATEIFRKLPLDFPQLGYEVIKIGEDGGQTQQMQLVHYTRSGLKENRYWERQIRMVKKTINSELSSIQDWHEGDPWWREAKSFKNGKLIHHSLLLEGQREK